MRTKLLMVLLVASVLAVTAWLVQAPKPAQAGDIPEKYRETVRKGLEYLVKHQSPDGHWEGDGGKYPMAMTGLAGLALLMEMGPRARFTGKEPYLANIRKAADWLMNQSAPSRDGLIFSGHPSETTRYMEGHGQATIFLAGVWPHERDPATRKKLTDVLRRAVKYLAKARSSRGGWYHTSRAEGHDFDAILPTVIQIQALQAAENAGVAVSANMSADAEEYVNTAMRDYAKANQVEDSSRSTDIAAALACRSNPGDRSWCKKALELLPGRDPRGSQDQVWAR